MKTPPLQTALFACGLCLAVAGFLGAAAVSIAADQVTLAWDPNSESDLAGYRLYIQDGDADPGYRLLATIPLSDIDSQAPSFSVFELMPATQYRFVVTAYNLNGDESGLSNSVCVSDGRACDAPSSDNGSGGCFLNSLLNIPSAWKTPAPAR